MWMNSHWPEILRFFLAAFVVFVLPFVDIREARRMRDDPAEWRRLRFYRSTVALLWLLAVLAFAATGLGILQVPHGAQARWIFGGPVRFWVVAALAATYFGLGLAPGAVCLAKPAKRAAYTRAMKSLSFLLPGSQRERAWFALVSVSAGVCEELIFRGFLLGLLRSELAMGLTLAWVVSSVIFGINHLYQGKAGVMRSTVAGAALGLMAILSGGLVLPMLLHCVADLQILVMYRPEPRLKLTQMEAVSG